MLKLAPHQTVKAILVTWEFGYIQYSKECSKSSPTASLPPALLRNTLYNITSKGPWDIGLCWLRRQPLAWLKRIKHSLARGIYKRKEPHSLGAETHPIFPHLCPKSRWYSRALSPCYRVGYNVVTLTTPSKPWFNLADTLIFILEYPRE